MYRFAVYGYGELFRAEDEYVYRFAGYVYGDLLSAGGSSRSP